jgi:phosphoenolpyruvate carboxykinase (GTP)
MTPTGWIPKYKDLRRLFKEVLDKDYKKQDYTKQFTIRVQENLDKIKRVERFYNEKVADTPVHLFEVLDQQRERLFRAKKVFGSYIPPENFKR